MKKRRKTRGKAKTGATRKSKHGKTKTVRSRAARTVDEYLARVPEPARSTLRSVREAIRSIAPEGSTEVISYGIPAFRHKKVLMWYAAFRKHCSVFPTSAVIQRFRNELEGYTISKGTIQFPVDRPLPSELIRKMVRANVEQE